MIKKLLLLIIDTKIAEINNRKGYSDLYLCGMVQALIELGEDIKANL